MHIVAKLAEESDEAGNGTMTKSVKNKLEAALTAKQEAEAKAASLEGKVTQYESEIADLKARVCYEI